MYDELAKGPVIVHRSGAVEIDARQYILGGGDPYSFIIGEATELAAGGTLYLRAPFEPKPMMRQLERLGYDVRSEEVDPDHWLVTAVRATRS